MDTAALNSWDEEVREELCHQIMARGWSRQFPDLGAIFMTSIAIKGSPSTLADLQRFIGHPANSDASWEGSCWDEFEPHTAESLADLNAQFGDDDERNVEEVNAEGLAFHNAMVAQVDGYAAHLGLGPVRTCRELLDVIVATGVVQRDEDGLLRPAYPLPLPEDVLPLSDEELATLQEMRVEDDLEQTERE